jgi:hypothetical protein
MKFTTLPIMLQLKYVTDLTEVVTFCLWSACNYFF